MPGGRPSTYSFETAKEFCRRLLECTEDYIGRSMFDVCQDSDMPSVSCIVEWRMDHPEFAALYNRQTEIRAEMVAESQRVIAAACPANPYDVAKAKLVIDTNKWWLSCVSKNWRDKASEISQTVQISAGGLDLKAIRAGRGLPEKDAIECESEVYEVCESETTRSGSTPAAALPLTPNDSECQSENLDFEVEF